MVTHAVQRCCASSARDTIVLTKSFKMEGERNGVKNDGIVRKMRGSAHRKRNSIYLQFRMHILRELRGADEPCLSKLRRRTRATAAPSRRLYFERRRGCLIR